MMTKSLTTSRTLGKGSIPPELIIGELPSTLQSLEHFACHVYSSKGPTTLRLLRWELFLSKNFEGEMLPPTRAALLPHILHANYVTMRDKSYLTNCPELPPIEENRWNSVFQSGVLPSLLQRQYLSSSNMAAKQVARDVAAAQITCLSLHGEDCVNTIRLDIEDDNDEDNRSCMSEMTAL